MNENFNHRKFNCLLLAIFFIFTGCSAQKEEIKTKKSRSFSTPVQLGKVIYKAVEDQVRTIGVFIEKKRVVISSEIDGKIIKITFREGMEVKANDILAKIDPRDYQIEVVKLRHRLDSVSKELKKAKSGLRPEEQEQLRAQESIAQSNLDLALKNKNRIEALVDQGIVAQATLDSSMHKVLRSQEQLKASQANRKAGRQFRKEDIAKITAQVEGIKKQYEKAKLNLSRTIIRAPFDGIVIKKNIEQGVFIESEDPILEIGMSHKVIAGITLPQKYRNKLKNLEGIKIFIKDLNIKFLLDKKHSKRIQVLPEGDIYSGNFNFLIDLPKDNPNLFPGLTFEAILTMSKREKILHVPSTALVLSERGTNVYIMKEGKAHLVPVRAFMEQDGFVEIQDFTKQLNSNVELILRGSGAVFPGAQVMVANLPP